MAMAKDKHPFETPCFDFNKTQKSKVFGMNNKRKLQAEQLGLPSPKHQCGNSSQSSASVDSENMDTLYSLDYMRSSFKEEETPPKEFELYDSQNFSETIEELEGLLCLNNDEYSGDLMLSSGRWNVNQKNSKEVVKKPTIDQEFEEYFSMLML